MKLKYGFGPFEWLCNVIQYDHLVDVPVKDIMCVQYDHLVDVPVKDIMCVHRQQTAPTIET